MPHLRSLVLVLLFPTALAALSACTDDDPTGPEDEMDLATVTLMDGYLPEGAIGFVFASDATGKLIDSAKVVEEGVPVTLRGSWGGEDDWYTLTLMKSGPTVFSLHSYHRTSAPVNIGFMGYENPPLAEQATIEFADVPEHEAFQLSASRTTRSGAQLGSPQTFSVYADTVSAYLRLDPVASAPAGLWISDLVAGEARTLDCSQLDPLVPRTLSIHSGGDRLDFSIWHWEDFEYDRTAVIFEKKHFEGALPPSLTYYLPESARQELLYTRFEFYDPLEPLKIYKQWHIVGLPASFVKMAADFEVVSASPDSCRVVASGDWQKLEAVWTCPLASGSTGGADGKVPATGSWQLDFHSQRAEFVLPQLPADILAEWPGLERDDFLLDNVTLITSEAENQYRSVTRYGNDEAARQARANAAVASPWTDRMVERREGVGPGFE